MRTRLTGDFMMIFTPKKQGKAHQTALRVILILLWLTTPPILIYLERREQGRNTRRSLLNCGCGHRKTPADRASGGGALWKAPYNRPQLPAGAEYRLIKAFALGGRLLALSAPLS